jgi:hypothetical protein
MDLHGWSADQKRVARFHCGGYLAAYDEESRSDLFAYQPFTLTNILISGSTGNYYSASSIRFVVILLRNSILRNRVENLLAEVFIVNN